MSREIRHRYDDPVDLVWLACARELGICIVRSAEVYASYDGSGTLTLSSHEHFDADDSLAQLIFHELCHALVAGPRAMERTDWGMENVDARDLLAEHACHRLQAALADRYGLRGLFGVTTDHRPYWDALPVDPLGPGADPAIPLAREAFARATDGPWSAALAKALARTAEIASIAREAQSDAHSVWSLTRPLHASGFPVGDDASRTCADCAWAFVDRGTLRCRHTKRGERERGLRVDAEAQACTRFEPRFDERECATCGACCREAFDRVEVRARDLLKKRQPELIVRDGYGDHLPRPSGRCVALTGDGETSPYRCQVYEARPQSCAEFAVAGDACLEARRRVGMSA